MHKQLTVPLYPLITNTFRIRLPQIATRSDFLFFAAPKTGD